MKSLKIQRNLFLILFLLATLAVILMLSSARWYYVYPEAEVNKVYRDSLVKLAIGAGQHRDMPFSAVLLYRDSMIGHGINTVIRDSSFTGHAEINALQMAFKSYGPQAFSKLNHDEMLMLTTYEPCAMCKGALCFYGITRVVFYKPKAFVHWKRDHVNELKYDLRIRSSGQADLQDSIIGLFQEKLGIAAQSE